MKWKYKILTYDIDPAGMYCKNKKYMDEVGLQKILNAWGQQGWELVSITVEINQEEWSRFNAYFKKMADSYQESYDRVDKAMLEASKKEQEKVAASLLADFAGLCGSCGHTQEDHDISHGCTYCSCADFSSKREVRKIRTHTQRLELCSTCQHPRQNHLDDLIVAKNVASSESSCMLCSCTFFAKRREEQPKLGDRGNICTRCKHTREEHPILETSPGVLQNKCEVCDCCSYEPNMKVL